MLAATASRASTKNVAGDWRSRAAKIVADQVYPALNREIAAVSALRASSRQGDGVWRVPHGDEIYAAALAEATTTKFTADEIHKLGLKIGIYGDAGDKTCGGYAGSLGHEQVDAKTFADWGIDCGPT